jgi:ABC-type Fe3+-siderophore transport system permease subunit
MLCLLCVSAGAFLGDLLATLLVYVTEFYFFMSWSVTFLCGLLGVCLFFVFIYFIDSQSDKSESLRFIKTFYSSKKNKFCPSIELE